MGVNVVSAPPNRRVWMPSGIEIEGSVAVVDVSVWPSQKSFMSMA